MTITRETTIVKEYEKKSMVKGEYNHEKLRKVSRKLFVDEALKIEDVQECNEKRTVSPQIYKYCKSFTFHYIKS